MKKIIFISIMLCCSICLGQSYFFNKEIIYNCSNARESQDSTYENRRYFINTENSKIVAILIDKGEDRYKMIFRDDKKDRIAEVSLDNFIISENGNLDISRSYLVHNSYHGIRNLKDYEIKAERLDSSTTKFVYSYSKKSNPRNITSHTLHTTDVKFSIHSGIGFGDYYSRLKWDKELKNKLIIRAYTNRKDGSITDDNRLESVRDVQFTILFK
ncbi:hypothetical protein EAX61_04435 [Dokdonia sinensis]|uniref:Uncharacterized protein n=1 Tax=Dokdonia sinensis TaxID=2479847 RepID=A0A3M0GDF5_9FLAO|nr:hypothetical protein [Dokdonia sinensis]RMB62834.1 hypothetical protein EAX61_04435 [Dokdonia sinensis]